MGRCASHGELVGGYVLGALEPSEMEEMRGHVAGCPTCRPEVRRMSALPGLLDTAHPSDVPPPAASPEVEEAILDRFVRERRRAAAPPRRRHRRRVFAALAAACVVGIALVFALLSAGDEKGSSAYATARLTPIDSGSNARATAWVDAIPAGTSVSLGARGLDGGGAVYQLWCVRPNGEWVSGGTFRSNAEGKARAELTAAVKPGDYHEIVVTQGARSAERGAQGRPVLRGELRY
jgi:anti-sigma-K factor RskA